MFGGMKDSLASGAAKALLAGRIERYGRLLDLRIRSREKTMSAVILLAGESEELRIEVGRYRVVEDGGKSALIIEQLSASREWLQLLLEDLLVGRPLTLPKLATLAFGGAGAS
jgi:hypothetical protein